jgi:hypothetical protein
MQFQSVSLLEFSCSVSVDMKLMTMHTRMITARIIFSILLPLEKYADGMPAFRLSGTHPVGTASG